MLANVSVHAEERPEKLEIRVKAADHGKSITIQAINKTDRVLKLWDTTYSWGWGNWSFHFYQGNGLYVYVRKPDVFHTMNIPRAFDIPAHGTLDFTFDLKRNSWVEHRIPVYPKYLHGGDAKNAVRGCMAILSVPRSSEGQKQKVWKGTIASPFFKLPH
ncbi:MAG: hypothetical protein ACAI35_03715 [Candidatus Methylacidiphilales bacterium]|nr:hypothetical protein [Candidatus Methylacidiphilales bacterium]